MAAAEAAAAAAAAVVAAAAAVDATVVAAAAAAHLSPPLQVEAALISRQLRQVGSPNPVQLAPELLLCSLQRHLQKYEVYLFAQVSARR